MQNIQLPGNIQKTYNELARAKEKSARHKYMLDLFESIVVHLCAFTLGEYKRSDVFDMKLEKEIINSNRGLSFGKYIGFLRDTGSVLKSAGFPSKVDNVVFEKKHTDFGFFEKAYKEIKEQVLSERDADFVALIDAKRKESTSAQTMMSFFNKLVELRNKVAHSSGFEHKGKMLSWPQNENYFDSINPVLERILELIIAELNGVWEYKSYLIQQKVDHKFQISMEDGDDTDEIETNVQLESGTRILFSAEKEHIVTDWRHLMIPHPDAVEELKKAEEDLRNKTNKENIKEAIRAALEDKQISVEEFQFFESLGRTKLNLSKEEIKQLILEVSKEMDIENPFPETDLRYVQLLDDAIKNNSFNEFSLKMAGTQYGIDSEEFERLFLDRCAILNTDPDYVRKNAIQHFTAAELADFVKVFTGWTWLDTLITLKNNDIKSIFKNKSGAADIEGSKEYKHRSVFENVQSFVVNRLQKINKDNSQQWETKINNWQQGNMSGYAWCSIFPKNSITLKVLSLNVSLVHNKLQVGFLPDYKDRFRLENYGVLRSVLSNHLLQFSKDYLSDLEKYPELQMIGPNWNFDATIPMCEIPKQYQWYMEHVYDLEEIQFFLSPEKIANEPHRFLEYFDINFGLFNGLIPKIIKDYENALSMPDPFTGNEDVYFQSLREINQLVSKYGLNFSSDASKNNTKSQSKSADDEDVALEEALPGDLEELDMESSYNSQEKWIYGNNKRGVFFLHAGEKNDKHLLLLQIGYRSDVLKNNIRFYIKFLCRGSNVDSVTHQKLNRIIEKMSSEPHCYFVNGTFMMIQEVKDHQVQMFTEITNKFLQEFTIMMAKDSVQCLDLKPYIEEIELNKASVNSSIDACTDTINFKNVFSNKIQEERSWMKKCRYIDWAGASPKGVNYWIGWGYFLNEYNLMAGVKVHVSDSILGAHVIAKLKEFASNHDKWFIKENQDDDVANGEWMIDKLGNKQISSSSEHSKYCKAINVKLNQKKYWYPKSQNESQWIQFDFAETLRFSHFKIGGSEEGKHRVTSFNLHYSTNGKNWQILENIIVEDQSDIQVSHAFLRKFEAKFVKICPIKWENGIALKFDLFGEVAVPSSFEMEYMKKINHADDYRTALDDIPAEVDLLKQSFPGELGLKK